MPRRAGKPPFVHTRAPWVCGCGGLGGTQKKQDDRRCSTCRKPSCTQPSEKRPPAQLLTTTTGLSTLEGRPLSSSPSGLVFGAAFVARAIWHPLYAQVGGPFLGPRRIGARIFKPEAEFESERGGPGSAKSAAARIGSRSTFGLSSNDTSPASRIKPSEGPLTHY